MHDTLGAPLLPSLRAFGCVIRPPGGSSWGYPPHSSRNCRVAHFIELFAHLPFTRRRLAMLPFPFPTVSGSHSGAQVSACPNIQVGDVPLGTQAHARELADDTLPSADPMAFSNSRRWWCHSVSAAPIAPRGSFASLLTSFPRAARLVIHHLSRDRACPGTLCSWSLTTEHCCSLERSLVLISWIRLAEATSSVNFCVTFDVRPILFLGLRH